MFGEDFYFLECVGNLFLVIIGIIYFLEGKRDFWFLFVRGCCCLCSWFSVLGLIYKGGFDSKSVFRMVRLLKGLCRNFKLCVYYDFYKNFVSYFF